MDKLLHQISPPVADRVTGGENSAFLLVDDCLSLATALAAFRGGQQFTPYVVSFGKYPELVRIAADRLRWDLNVISVPTHKPSFDFIRLALRYRCVTRLEFEYGFLLMHGCASIREQRIVWPIVNRGSRLKSTLQRIAERNGKALLVPANSDETVTRVQIEAMIETATAHSMARGPETP